jgi:hypothetical protein
MNESFYQKLRLRASWPVLVLNAPAGYIEGLTSATEIVADSAPKIGLAYEMVQIFIKTQAELELFAPIALKALIKDGILWASYPKASSGTQTDLSRDTGWEFFTREQFRPVTALSMDTLWTCLRFRHQADVKVPVRTRQARIAAGLEPRLVRKPVPIPADLLTAMEAAPGALKIFEGLAYTYRKEYCQWVNNARREDTRADRIARAVLMIGQGKKLS